MNTVNLYKMDAETSASYEQAGFGHQSEFGSSPALVVVDMCAAYFDSQSPLFLDRPEVADAVRKVIGRARKAGVPVVWTRVEYEPGGANGGVWYAKLPEILCAFDRGNQFGQWLEGLAPAGDEVVVTKQHASGFFGTDLADQLRRLGVDSLLITGVSTSGCVRATATDASAWGFKPFVIRECVGDRTDQVNESNLFDLNAKYADVIDQTQALEYLDGSAQES